MVMAEDRPSTSELEPREPTVEDLRDLCRELNRRQARYIVVGGFAVRAAGYNRRTMAVDLVVAADPDNESRVFSALSTLPDNAVRELQPGELQQCNVTIFFLAVFNRAGKGEKAGGVDQAAAAVLPRIPAADAAAPISERRDGPLPGAAIPVEGGRGG